VKVGALLLFIVLLTSCPSPSVSSSGGGALTTAQAEANLTAALENVDPSGSEVDFSFAIERADGRRFVYQRGTSTIDTRYESASTSKLVSAVIILRQVDKGALALTDHPQTWLTGWPIPADDTLNPITLSQLLSFTSGLVIEPAAMNSGTAAFFTVVNTIGSQNTANGRTPGTNFYYASTHLQVAGAMAIMARGKATWQDLFSEFQSETGLFPTGTYDLPSSTNPRLAGGMHWTGREYLDFLKALRDGKLLSARLMAQLLQDHTAAPVVMEASPAATPRAPDWAGEDWHYGFGSWHEVRPPATKPVPGDRISSPGAYGAYPFWDRKLNLIGMVARQGALGTWFEGVNVARTVEAATEAWTAAPVSP